MCTQSGGRVHFIELVMNHFFVKPEQICEEEIVITGSDVNHIRTVLRMKSGEQLVLSDGEGHDYTCSISSLSESEIRCRILARVSSGTEPEARFYLFQGMPKADKLEHIIQKSVELGVYEIIPVETSRCIVRYDAKKQRSKLERWRKIAESAAKQSRRGIIPQVREIMTFRDAVAYAAHLDLVLIPYENFKDMDQTRAVLSEIRPGMKVGIFVGPEGGFEQSEVALAIAPVKESMKNSCRKNQLQTGDSSDAAERKTPAEKQLSDPVESSDDLGKMAAAEEQSAGAGARQISLGTRILRTETAPLMLLSILVFGLELYSGIETEQ